MNGGYRAPVQAFRDSLERGDARIQSHYID
jgi:hypothetical protein